MCTLSQVVTSYVIVQSFSAWHCEQKARDLGSVIFPVFGPTDPVGDHKNKYCKSDEVFHRDWFLVVKYSDSLSTEGNRLHTSRYM